jgi:hypothetical protein
MSTRDLLLLAAFLMLGAVAIVAVATMAAR